MSNKTQLRRGDRVKVIQWIGRRGKPDQLGDTLYVVMDVEGYRCEISEVKAGSAGFYSPQVFDTHLLRKVA